jgi:molybdopterin/thiamine biosynthesis adenylyltransferase
LGGQAAPLWVSDPDVPSYPSRTGFALKIDPVLKDRVKADWDFVEAVVQTAGHEPLSNLLAEATEQAVLLVECGGDVHLIWLPAGSGKRTLLGYVAVPLPADAERLPPQYAQLAKLSVAIIGCGSIGSKVVASLGRAGVGSFVLVDGDIFFPGNLVRSDLDWRSVGLNKPDAIAMRVQELRATTAVTIRRIVLGGQESGALTDLTLVEVGKCDLIIDATADPQVFNLCAAVARNERKPLVWGEVFAGGVGGLIARTRPETDPVPHAARRQILKWCADRDIEPPQGGAVPYDGSAADTGQPLVADDADVSVIAGQLARLALDTLTQDESGFPHSAYAIGLKKGWIFEAPFDTWPIALTPEGEWGPEKDERLDEEITALSEQLFPQLGRDQGE